MKASVERLRWGLVAAAVLLLLMLAVFLGYGRYKQLKKWQAVLAKLHLHGPHETTDFTYSSSPKDRTSYKVHAAKVIEHGDGKWSLHDVAVTLYGKSSGEEDHLYASDIEYDQKSGIASAAGAVNMDLQLPGALGKGKMSPQTLSLKGKEKDNDRIHVATSGLVYIHRLGVASTSQPVEFRYAGMECTSKGAEFDSGDSMLHLLSDVVMTGVVRDAPFTLHAMRADLDRDAYAITLARSVAQSQGRTVVAANAVVHLRGDGSVQRVEADGGVTFDEGTRHLTAASYEGTFGVMSLPLAAKLEGKVVATDTSVARPMRSQAEQADVVFDADGNPSNIVATGAAQMMLAEHKPGSPDLAREVRGDQIIATFARTAGRKGRSQLREVHAMGSAMARGSSLVAAKKPGKPGLKTTQVTADDLRAVFVAGEAQKPELRQVFGNGHARLQVTAPLGEEQTSSSDALEITFAPIARAKKGVPSMLKIASALQSGNVTIHSVAAAKPGMALQTASDATAASAVYDGATAKLVLRGGASFVQGQTSLTATTIIVDQRTQDAEADGEVMATLTHAPSKESKTTSVAEQTTHIEAQRVTLLHSSQLSEFFGTPSHPARMWQGASQVQATTLLFDQKKKSLLAKSSAGMQIHAVFANESQVSARKPGTRIEGHVIRVRSAAMDYDDIHRQAVFTGGVSMDATTAQAQAQTAVVLLSPAASGTKKPASSQPESVSPFGGSLRRIVLSEHVRMEQPGRTGTGEQLVYTTADGTYVLTGTPGRPPHIVDAQQGSLTGAMLLFHGEDSTIIVTGATPQDKRGRVRTEVEVRGK